MRAYKPTDRNGIPSQTRVACCSTAREDEEKWEVGKSIHPRQDAFISLYASPVEANLYEVMPLPRVFVVEVEAYHDSGIRLEVAHPVAVLDEMYGPYATPVERVAWALCLAPHPLTLEFAIAWLAGKDGVRGAVEPAKTLANRMWELPGNGAGRACEAVCAVLAFEEAYATAKDAWALSYMKDALWCTISVALSGPVREPDELRAFNLGAFERARRILKGELPAEQYAGELMLGG